MCTKDRKPNSYTHTRTSHVESSKNAQDLFVIGCDETGRNVKFIYD